MRFLLDENEPRSILAPLIALYPMHDFDWSVDILGPGVDDVSLIQQMVDRGYQCLITRDGAQLTNDHERLALYESGIHWIGHKPVRAKGVHMISTLASTYTLAMPHILEILKHADSSMAINVFHSAKKGHDIVRTHRIDPHRRYSNPR